MRSKQLSLFQSCLLEKNPRSRRRICRRWFVSTDCNSDSQSVPTPPCVTLTRPLHTGAHACQVRSMGGDLGKAFDLLQCRGGIPMVVDHHLRGWIKRPVKKKVSSKLHHPQGRGIGAHLCKTSRTRTQSNPNTAATAHCSGYRH